MSEHLARQGYTELGELASTPGYPDPERARRGPVAVIECIQPIPCDPCESSCPHGAICVGKPITNLPVLDAEACIGCGLCLPQCPGLAIFLVDTSADDGTARVSFPYEYYPLPEAGQKVTVVDRGGRPVGEGTVLRVQNPVRNRHTAIVTVQVPVELAEVVRSIEREGRQGQCKTT